MINDEQRPWDSQLLSSNAFDSDYAFEEEQLEKEEDADETIVLNGRRDRDSIVVFGSRHGHEEGLGPELFDSDFEFEEEILTGVGTKRKDTGFLAHGGAGGTPVFMGEGNVIGVVNSFEEEEGEETPRPPVQRGSKRGTETKGNLKDEVSASRRTSLRKSTRTKK